MHAMPAPYMEVECPSSPACYLTSALPLSPLTHTVLKLPYGLILPQTEGSFCFLLSAFCGLSFKLFIMSKWEIKPKLSLFNILFSSHTWTQQGAARGRDNYSRTQWMSSIWLYLVAMTCLSSASPPRVQPPYLRNTWHALLWMCLVSTLIVKRIRQLIISHLASLFFS
jgi:hypothetical protein